MLQANVIEVCGLQLAVVVAIQAREKQFRIGRVDGQFVPGDLPVLVDIKLGIEPFPIVLLLAWLIPARTQPHFLSGEYRNHHLGPVRPILPVRREHRGKRLAALGSELFDNRG